MSDSITTTRFDLWGGIASISTHSTSSAAHDRAVDAVRGWVDAVDAAASTYRSDSEITALNDSGGAPFPVGPLLAEALRVALRAADISSGAVDPTVGTITLSAAAAVPTVVRKGTYRDVTITDHEGVAVVSMPAGVRLDLGATAKAWAADRAAELAAAAADTGVLVSLSGDIAMSGPAPAGGWVVLVTDDHREGADSDNAIAQTVSLMAGGLEHHGAAARDRAGPVRIPCD